MGQAKVRKQEIAKLKADGSKSSLFANKQIAMFGAFYRDDQDDGVSIAFSTHKDPKPGYTKFLYNALTEVKDSMLAEVKAGVIDTDWIWDQLHYSIVNYNLKAFGTSVRPGKCEIQVNVLDIMEEIIVIMGNIWVLTELGEIHNDTFNGMMFAYSN